jgi:hypothetical protein
VCGQIAAGFDAANYLHDPRILSGQSPATTFDFNTRSKSRGAARKQQKSKCTAKSKAIQQLD